MLRKELRRHERRDTFRRRLLAGSTAVILAFGMAAGGAAPAFASPPSSSLPAPIVDAGGVTSYDQGGLVCDSASVGFQKPDELDSPYLDSDGSYSAAWGTITWNASTRTVSWTIVDGWDVDVCVKGGTVLTLLDTSEFAGTSYTHTYAGLSHLGFRINASNPGNDLDCVTATNFQGRALTNGDHITMDIVQNGTKFQVNAQIDIRQSQDPASESGLVVRVNAPGGPYTLPITNDQKNSGVFEFEYSDYLTGQWTVEWVQFNSTYFNQNRDSTKFLVCGELPPLPITNASIGFIEPTCDEGQKLDPTKLLVDDETLAKLERYEEFDDGTFEVVFVTTDEDARFFDSNTPVAGRVVSEGGTVLTFTGTLAGPLTGDDCVRSVVVVDPYGVDDRCLTAPSYWIELIEGITYTITVDDEAPVVVEWAGTDERRTFPADRGSTLRIEAAPASDRFTLAPQPGPLTHTFAVYPAGCLPTLPLTEGSVTFTPATCLDATNWVVLPNVDGVQWWVDGKQAASGTWPMAAGDVVVEATPMQGYGFSAEAETRWEYTFPTADEACDLSSLAETGASNALVGVGLAAVLITLAGFGVVIGRRFQQA